MDEKLLALPSGSTRINVKLRAGQETDINAPGPEIPPQAVEQLLARLDSLSQGDVLVLAGSIPPGLPPSFYGDVLHRLQGRGVRCVVDAQGEALRQALPQRPFLIKPNRAELEELAGRPLQDARRVQQAAQALQPGAGAHRPGPKGRGDGRRGRRGLHGGGLPCGPACR